MSTKMAAAKTATTMSAQKKRGRKTGQKKEVLILQNLDQLHKPDSLEYELWLEVLRGSTPGNPELMQLFAILEPNICHLGEDYKSLITEVMKINWLDRGPDLCVTFQAFVLNLVSAHMLYLRPCLNMLVKYFTPDQEKEDSATDEATIAKIEYDRTQVHTLLQSLSKIVPMTSEVLPSIMEQQFPFINRSIFKFDHYTRNLLAVSRYIVNLRTSILELLVNNMLKLDVRSPRLDISTAIFAVDDEDVMDSRDEAMFDMEEELNEMSVSEEKPTLKETDVVNRLAETLPHAGALDVMMGLCLKYIREICYVKGELQWEETKKLYRELLWIFDKYIFPTHESCHVQFLLFYICSFKEALSDGFIDYMLKKVTDPTAQCVYRQTAACYIGSFISRAQYLPLSTSRQTLELLMRWVHSYLDQTSDVTLHADLEHHGAFYAICQTTFYIFCFLHNDFIQSSKKGQRWAESLNFQRVVTSKLNPLRVCMPIIVKTFASASRMHQLAFCDTIIERNGRYSLPVMSSRHGSTGSHGNTLESYFPFDPYLLPGSSPEMAPLYREFHGSLPDINTEHEEEDDFLPDEDEPSGIDIGATRGGKSSVDLLHYSVSPGFKHT